KGWLGFVDSNLRSGSPLLSRAQWLTLLNEEGFRDAAAVPDSDKKREAYQVVLLARGPARIRHRAPIPRATTDTIRSWLLLAGEDETAQNVATHMAARGDRCFLVTAGPAYRGIADGKFQIWAGKKEEMQRVVEAGLARDAGLHGVIFFWSVERARRIE